MNGPLVLVTPDDLARIVREQVDAALVDLGQDSTPALVDRAACARALGISTGTLDKLRAQGMPEVKILDCVRFDVGDCVVWLKGRQQ